MESTFYTITSDENDTFPEVEEIVDCFGKHFDLAGRPDPDNDLDFYKIAVGGVIDSVCDELNVYNVPVGVNIYLFSDDSERDHSEIVENIIVAHETNHEVPYIAWS
jgi:hypothetical protein